MYNVNCVFKETLQRLKTRPTTGVNRNSFTMHAIANRTRDDRFL